MTILQSLAAIGRRVRSMAETLLTYILIVTCAAILWRLESRRSSAAPRPVHSVPEGGRPEPPLPSEPISITGAAIQGNASAKAVIVEYSDFQCPFCGQFAREVLPTLEQRYVATGRARLVFEQMPLPIHRFAFGAAVASACADQQGKFWLMHDALFADQKNLGSVDFRAIAAKIGGEPTRFEACIADQAVADRVKQNLITASTLSINGTPTFFVGSIQSDGRVRVSKRFTGVTGIEDFGAAIDAVSASAGTSAGKG